MRLLGRVLPSFSPVLPSLIGSFCCCCCFFCYRRDGDVHTGGVRSDTGRHLQQPWRRCESSAERVAANLPCDFSVSSRFFCLSFFIFISSFYRIPRCRSLFPFASTESRFVTGFRPHFRFIKFDDQLNLFAEFFFP